MKQARKMRFAALERVLCAVSNATNHIFLAYSFGYESFQKMYQLSRVHIFIGKIVDLAFKKLTQKATNCDTTLFLFLLHLLKKRWEGTKSSVTTIFW